MATDRTFNDMLNEYLPFELLKDELIKRMYVLQNAQMDQNWKGGNLVVPFQGGHASSFRYNQLTTAANISEDKYVRGNVSGYKELWGTMKFNSRDLAEHSAVSGQSAGQVSEQSFLKILPDTLDDFMGRMKEVTSVNFLSGPHFATQVSEANAATGQLVYDHPERFTIDQEVVLEDDGTEGFVTYFVLSIDINTKEVEFSLTRGGAAVDFTSATNIFTAANATKAYVQDAHPSSGFAGAFSSLPDQLLSAANGGAATQFGQTKTAYPYLQATNIDGSTITATNILDEIFDGWTEVKKLGRATKSQDCVMDYTNLGSVMKKLQLDSGPFRFTSSKADLFGWTELKVIGVNGELKLVGVHEADDDKIMFLDWGGIKVCSNGLFRMQKTPEGLLYFTVRNADGYEYIVDSVLFGELICYKLSSQGIIHTVSYP